MFRGSFGSFFGPFFVLKLKLFGAVSFCRQAALTILLAWPPPAEPRGEKKTFFCANFGQWKTFKIWWKMGGETFLVGLRGAKHFSIAFRIVFRILFSRFSNRFSYRFKNFSGANSFCTRAALTFCGGSVNIAAATAENHASLVHSDPKCPPRDVRALAWPKGEKSNGTALNQSELSPQASGPIVLGPHYPQHLSRQKCTPVRNHCKIHSDTIIFEIFQEIDSQTFFPWNSLNHKETNTCIVFFGKFIPEKSFYVTEM